MNVAPRKKPLIYVAGPLGRGATRQPNVRRSFDEANAVMDCGAAIILPHLTHFFDEVYPHHYEVWMDQDFEQIARCDAIYRYPGESPGATREVDHCEKYGVPVLRSIERVRAFVEHWRGSQFHSGVDATRAALVRMREVAKLIDREMQETLNVDAWVEFFGRTNARAMIEAANDSLNSVATLEALSRGRTAK